MGKWKEKGGMADGGRCMYDMMGEVRVLALMLCSYFGFLVLLSTMELRAIRLVPQTPGGGL